MANPELALAPLRGLVVIDEIQRRPELFTTLRPLLHVALEDLALERAWIVYPGTTRYPVHQRVEVLPLTDVMALKTAVG